MKRAHPVRAFRRAWQRQAEKLPPLGRAGRWALDVAREKPRLSEGPLFGTALGELTGADVAKREAPHRPARRNGRAAEAPAPPAPGTSETRTDRRLSRHETPGEPAPPRALPAEAPGADIARWAGERTAQTSSEPVRRKRVQPAGPRSVPDHPSVALHQKEIAARSLRPLSVERRSKGFPGDLESTAIGGHRDAPATPEVSRLRNRSGSSAALPDRRSGDLEAPFTEPGSQTPPSALPNLETIKNDPWSTLVSGAQAPRALLADAVRETAPPAQRRKTAAPGRPDPGHSATPLSPDGQNPPAGSPPPDLPRSTHDRSDAPRFDAHEGHPPPFTPIAGDPLPPHAAASPLGPFPGAAAVSRAFEAAQDAPAFPTDSFPAFSSAPASADELAELAAKIERILTDEARRHGIDI